MVTDTGGINDRSFNQSAWEGLNQLNPNAFEIAYLVSKTDADYDTNIQTFIADQSYLAPETVITSAVKRVDIAVQNIAMAAKDGTFAAGVVMCDVTNGGVDIAPTQDLLTDEIKAAVETAKQGLINGTIVIPTTAEECTEFVLQ